MTDRIQCPVCQYAQIPRDMDTCPQCDSDLTCFQLLDRLSDKPPEQDPTPQETSTEHMSFSRKMPDERLASSRNPEIPSGIRQKPAIFILAAVTILVAGFFIFLTYRLSTVEHLLQRQHTALMDLVTSGVSLENDSQKQNQILELVRKQEITLAQSTRLKTYMENVTISIRENGTRLDRIESRLSHLLSHREMDLIPDRKKQSPVTIQPILIISEALETDTGSKVIGIKME